MFVSGCAAGHAYRKGQEFSRAGDWDSAVTEYTKAVQESPEKAEYKIALERATQSAARDHISRAHELETSDQLDAALIEYKRALELDPSNRLAASRSVELEKTIRDRIEASRPKPPIQGMREEARRASTPLLSPTSPLPVVSFGPNASVRDILNFIGTATGINVTYDQQYQDKAYTVRLEDVTLEQALQQITQANQLFYKVLNPKTIIVVPDNAQKHSQYDDLVVKVFYISHADVAEISQIINTIMRIPTMPVQPTVLQNKTANTLTVRATAAVMDVIERIIKANDKPRAEVIVDVQILEVNRNRTKQLGLNLSNYALGLTFSPEVAPPNQAGDLSRGAPAEPPPFNLNTISRGISTGGLLPERPDGDRQIPRIGLADQNNREAAAARCRRNQADPQLGRSDSRLVDGLRCAGAWRARKRAAVVVQLQGRRRQPRDDASSDLRGRDCARRVHRREQRSWRQHTCRGSGRADVQLAQGDHKAAAA